MDLTVGEDLLIADEPEAFAERIGVLWRDADLWRRLWDGGRSLVAQTMAAMCARNIGRDIVDAWRCIPREAITGYGVIVVFGLGYVGTVSAACLAPMATA